ncbi:hypothetical protein I4U23_031285 [Adineta vaga]|nr:hypothetical protein I4U23_031285 [Adineta vaga]
MENRENSNRFPASNPSSSPSPYSGILPSIPRPRTRSVGRGGSNAQQQPVPSRLQDRA